MNATARITEIMASNLSADTKAALILGLVQADAPAKAPVVTPRETAPKADAPKARALTKKSRLDFIAALPVKARKAYAGYSCWALAQAVLAGEIRCPKGFCLGEKRLAILAGE